MGRHKEYFITEKILKNYTIHLEKEDLRTGKKYKLSSINSFVIAANRLFEYMGWYGLWVKTYHIQKHVKNVVFDSYSYYKLKK